MPISQKQSNQLLKWLFLPLSLLALTALLALSAPGAGLAQEGASIVLELQPFVSEGQIARPTDIANAGDSRLFVVEREGYIRVVQGDGSALEEPFLDITDRVEWISHSERGLLGLAFHPDYAQNGYFYVNYTVQPTGDTHISRFQVTSDPNVADADSEEVLLEIDQPFGNHNGGDLAFGPQDGYLYIALGDGGSGNDPGNRAQRLEELLGKMLRIDVNAENGLPPDCGEPGAYTIPANNPFVGTAGACDEIWAWGLRNPWRFSFDRLTHDLYIGDVGQGVIEEIDFQEAASDGGENYGWSCFEGTRPNPQTGAEECEPASAYEAPIFEYNHDFGCAVTGGFVYRGGLYPDLTGRYILTDYCTGYFWDLDVENGWQATRHDNLQRFGFTTFGEGANGEIYVANTANGEILRVTAGEPFVLQNPVYLPVVRGR